MKLKSLLNLIFLVLFVEAVGITGALFTSPNIPGWYATINNPFFTPPSWLFGPAWTVLYFLMGISVFLLIQSKSKNKINAIKLFWMQLGVNFLWSILFFGLRNPLLGLLDIGVLIVLIVLLIKASYKVNKSAAYLLIPYLAWVSFATLLNLFVVILN
jgi:tryptophan-rich sensory protein